MNSSQGEDGRVVGLREERGEVSTARWHLYRERASYELQQSSKQAAVPLSVHETSTHLVAVWLMAVDCSIVGLEALDGQRLGCLVGAVYPVVHPPTTSASNVRFSRNRKRGRRADQKGRSEPFAGLSPALPRVFPRLSLRMPPAAVPGTAKSAQANNSVRAKSKQDSDNTRKTVFRPVLDNPLSVAW